MASAVRACPNDTPAQHRTSAATISNFITYLQVAEFSRTPIRPCCLIRVGTPCSTTDTWLGFDKPYQVWPHLLFLLPRSPVVSPLRHSIHRQPFSAPPRRPYMPWLQAVRRFWHSAPRVPSSR